MDAASNSATGRASQHMLLGQIIADKYQVERLLGRGGMGAVYEGKHLLLERQIAIKVMDTVVAEDERASARFLREAKAAARLEHNNAVTIYDFGVWQESTAYIVMEYIRGRSLREWLQEHKTASLEQTVEWLAQVCSAVSAAHTQGIIHRDLKPENIMLKETPEGDLIVKVVDFGLAKLVSGESSSGSHITKTGEVIGTPYYMAPEFYDGEEADHRADIYAIGVIAYEMLCGKAPFTGTVEKIIAGHLFQDVKPLSAQNEAIPPAVDEVINAALKKKRDQRIASANDLAKALRGLLSTNQGTGALSQPLTGEEETLLRPAINVAEANGTDSISKQVTVENINKEGHSTLEWREDQIAVESEEDRAIAARREKVKTMKIEAPQTIMDTLDVSTQQLGNKTALSLSSLGDANTIAATQPAPAISAAISVPKSEPALDEIKTKVMPPVSPSAAYKTNPAQPAMPVTKTDRRPLIAVAVAVLLLLGSVGAAGAYIYSRDDASTTTTTPTSPAPVTQPSDNNSNPEFHKGISDDDISNVILNGKPPRMPSYKDKMENLEVKELVAYIRGFGKKEADSSKN